MQIQIRFMPKRAGDLLQDHGAQFVAAVVRSRTGAEGNGVESQVLGQVYVAWCVSIGEEPSGGADPVSSGMIGKFMSRAGHVKKASGPIYAEVELTAVGESLLSECDLGGHSRGTKRPFVGLVPPPRSDGGVAHRARVHVDNEGGAERHGGNVASMNDASAHSTLEVTYFK